MYELIQVADNTYYMDCPAKVGFFKIASDEVVIIDSGNDKDAGKKVKKILDSQGWKLKAIYNTHSHADHIGGNQYLQNQTGCKVYAPGIECCFTEYPVLEPIALFGGNPVAELHNKFLMAKESSAEKLTTESLPEGMGVIQLPGHSYDMVGFRTSDNVVFLADCLSSRETINKYQIGYLYDVKAYIDTLEMVKTLEGAFFVPAHADASADIKELAQINIDKTKEIVEKIASIVESAKTFDEILAEVFDSYGLAMSIQQNVLIGNTVRSYLSYLKSQGLVNFFFENNKMYWKAVK